MGKVLEGQGLENRKEKVKEGKNQWIPSKSLVGVRIGNSAIALVHVSPCHKAKELGGHNKGIK